jgi:creatinine amidohydrolase
MELATHTTTTAAEAFSNAEVAVVPTGSVEQHGPALPLGTDLYSAAAVAESVAERDDVALTPPIPVGVSAHHRQFHGTLSVTPETFEDYAHDVVASLAEHGVRKAVFANGHGGNTDALTRAARRLRERDVAFATPWNWWSNLEGLEGELFDVDGITHADAMETSMMLYLTEHVREDALEDAAAGAADGWGESVHGAPVGFDTIDFSESGAVGHPTKGSADAGERLFEKATSELDALVDWLGEQDFADLRPEAHR